MKWQTLVMLTVGVVAVSALVVWWLRRQREAEEAAHRQKQRKIKSQLVEFPGQMPSPPPFRGAKSFSSTTTLVQPPQSVFWRGSDVHHIFVGIGMTYRGTSLQLDSCWNDVQALRRWWAGNFSGTVYLCSDEDRHSKYTPTSGGWSQLVHDVVTEALAVDTRGKRVQIMLVYSGHGFYGRAPSAQHESDGRSECILMADQEAVWDWQWHDSFLEPLSMTIHPCNVVAIFDSCHSGTMLNLNGTQHDGDAPEHRSTEQFDSANFANLTVWMLSASADNQTSGAGLPGKKDAKSVGTEAILRHLPPKSKTWAELVRRTRVSVRNIHPAHLQSPISSVSHPAIMRFDTPLFA